MQGVRTKPISRAVSAATIRRWAAGLALGAITSVLVFLLVQLSERFSDLRQSPEENFQWMAYQVGKEYDRLHLAVRTASEDLEAGERTIRLRMDILWSRFDLIEAPAFTDLDKAERIGRIEARFEDIDKLLSAPGRFDGARLEAIDQALSDGRKLVDTFILDILHHVGRTADAHRSNIERTLAYAFGAFSLLCAALFVTLFLVTRQSGRLQKRERELEEIARTLGDAQRIARLGSLSFNTVLKRLDCSSELKKICGIPQNESPSPCSLLRLIHPEDRGAIFRIIRKTLSENDRESRQTQDFELRLILKDDTLRHVRGSLEVQHGRHEGQATITVTLQDVTREVASVRALEAARDEADRANGAKSEFLAMMSHELRTPMNGVLGMLDALQDSCLTKDQEELVLVAHKSAEALLIILNDILDMSKIEAGKLELEQAPFELGSMIGVVGSLYRQEAENKSISLDWRIASDCPKWLVGDGIRLRQVLLNLVSNAVKFTSAGGVSIEVRETERGSHDASVLRFSIRDSGIGIPDQKRDHVFAPFDQLDRSYTRKFGGTGLGLAISKTLVELMGGTIDFESSPGYGTSFWCDIPFATALKPTETVGKTVEKRHRRLTVLVAEDDATNQLVARHILSALGHEATIVGDGLAAVSAANETRYDVILMDISLPEIDGIEAATRIRRSNGPSANVPIFAVSAHTMRDDIETCLRAGMNDFVSKPIDRAKLAGLLEGIEPATDASRLDVSSALSIDAAIEMNAAAGPAELRFSRIETLKAEIGTDALSAVLQACASDLKRAHALTLEAVRSDDIAAVRKAAHSIRGVASMIGDDQLVAEASVLLETGSKTGNRLETKTEQAIDALLIITAA